MQETIEQKIKRANEMGMRRWRERMIREKGLPPHMLARLTDGGASVGLTHPGAPSIPVPATQTPATRDASAEMQIRRMRLLRAAL